MMKAKRFSLLALALVLMLAVLLLAACRKDEEPEESTAPTTTAAPATTTAPAHVHAYTDTVVPPDCINGGYTSHVCGCGHTYTDTPTAAVGHSTVSKTTRYPTTLTTGVRRHTCTVCGHTYTEDIAVVTTFTLPSVADALAAALPKGDFSIDASDLILTLDETFYESHTEVIDGNYGDTTNLDPISTSATYALKVGTVDFSVTDAVVGEIELKFGTMAGDEFTSLLDFTFYIAGEDISVAVNGDETELGLSDSYYAALAASLGMPTEALTEMFYQMAELAKYEPIAEAIAEALVAAEFPTPGLDLLALLGSEIYSVESVIEGDVETVTTVIDLGAAVAVLAEYEDKTVADVLDDAYGEGTATAFFTHLTALPDMKISSIASDAISAAEALEIDLDLIYALINRIVYLATAEDFDLEAAILASPNMTLADVVVALAGAEANFDAAAVKAAVSAAVLTLSQDSFAELYHAAACPTEGGDVHAKADCEAFAEMLTMMEGMASHAFSLTTVETYTTVDGEGDDGETSVEYELVSLTLSTPLLSLTREADGDVFAEAYLGEYSFGYENTAEEGLQILVGYCGNTVLDIRSAFDDEGALVGYTVLGYGPVVQDGETDPTYELTFKYAVVIEGTQFVVYDVTETDELTDENTIACVALSPENMMLVIWKPGTAGTDATPAFGLRLSLGGGIGGTPDEDVLFQLAFALNIETSPTLDLLLSVERDEETGMIGLVLERNTDMGSETVAEVVYAPNEDGTFSLTVNAMGSEIVLYSALDEGVLTYCVEVDETPIAELTLNGGGFALDFPLDGFPLNGKIEGEATRVEDEYVFTLTFTDATIDSTRYDSYTMFPIEDDGQGGVTKTEVYVEELTESTYGISGEVIFTYVPAVTGELEE